MYKSLSCCIAEKWTQLTHTERQIQAFKTKCLRKVLQISYNYKEHKTNDFVQSMVTTLVE